MELDLVTSNNNGVTFSEVSLINVSASLLFRTPAKIRNPCLLKKVAQVLPIPDDAPVINTGKLFFIVLSIKYKK
jgi:hypothetical protein